MIHTHKLQATVLGSSLEKAISQTIYNELLLSENWAY